MRHFRNGQITELFTQANPLTDHTFKLAHSLNLLAIEWNQRWVGEADRNGFIGFFAGKERIGTALNLRAIGMFNGQELLGYGATAQLTQVGELAQEALTLLFEVGVFRSSSFHIVVILLQYKGQKQ